MRVIVGIPDRASSELSYADGLCGAFAQLECDASILVTGDGDKPADESTFGRSNVEVQRVPARIDDGLAEYWLETIRFLEERAPFLFLCSPSGVADWVYPRLSSRILVVPLLHRDDIATYEYCRLLGGSFDAVIPLNPSLRQRLIADFSDLAPRLAMPGAHEPHDAIGFLSAARACLTLAQKVTDELRSVPYSRKEGRMQIPAALPEEIGDRKDVESALQFINWKPRWPDPIASTSSIAIGSAERRGTPSSLSDVRIVVGLTSGRISGVDTFSVNLVRELCRLGLRAELLQTMPEGSTSDALPVTADVPTARLWVPDYPTWRQRWASLKSYLESEPTIFLPNYDDRHSAVIPALASHVRTVGIGHSDDPHYYQHLLRLASSWDAVIAVSSTIARHLTALSPALTSRLSVVPYGVNVPPAFDGASRRDGDPLRVAYTGRLVQYQKRVLDLLRIADEARHRGLDMELTVAGSGDDANLFAERAGAQSPRVNLVGSISNEEVQDLLARSHVFLLSSSFEGLPVSLLEAMARGCVPVITGIRSGVPDLIDDGRNGVLFGIGDTAAAASALARISTDDDLRMRVARAAYETVRSHYTIEKMARRYLEVFERILAAAYRTRTGRISAPRSIHAFDAHMPSFPLPVRKLIASARERFN